MKDEEARGVRKTKIICTLGPSSSSKEMIGKLVRAGMDIARLNFSHGNLEEHQSYISTVKEVSRDLGKPIGILQDLEGYKIRTGLLKNGKSIELRENDLLVLSSEKISGSDENIKWVSISYPEFYRFVKPGDIIFIDDGKIELQIQEVLPRRIKTRVIIGGLLGEKKGIHVPGVSIDFPSLTQKDRQDIRMGIVMGVDYIAQSFVQKAEDILLVKRILTGEGAENICVLAKIEDSKGVENIDEIIEVSDGIMIARGDMGVCLPRDQVPLIQKMIIKKCNQKGKPVITATQMLDSMIRNHQPTRAEVADIANAVIDGTDALLLSGETAIGSYPEESVKEMHRIAVTTEASLNYEQLLRIRGILPEKTISDSIGYITRQLAQLVNAHVIMAFTLSGNTAQIISKYRPRSRIMALTPNHSVAKKLLIYWGVEVQIVDRVPDIESYFENFLQQMVEQNLIGKGELVILTSGIKKEEEKPAGTIKILSA